MKITFIRHAHANHDRDDVNRVLSPKGLQAAFSLRKLFSSYKFDLIIHSSAKRTKETSEALFYGQEANVPTIEVASMYLPSLDRDIQIISKALMIMPFASPRELMQKTEAAAWNRYADEAYSEVQEVIKKFTPQKVLLIGHSSILNLLGTRFAPENKDLLERYFGYLEGYSLF